MLIFFSADLYGSNIIYGFNRFNDNISFTGIGDIQLSTDLGNFDIQQSYNGTATLFNNVANLNDNQRFDMIYDYKVNFISIFYKQNFNYVGDNYSNFSESSLINSNQFIGLGYKISELNFIRLFYGMDNHLQLGQASIGDAFEVESNIAFEIIDWQFGTAFDLRAIDRSFDREENSTKIYLDLTNSDNESDFNISANYNSLYNNYLRRIEQNNFNIENRNQDELDLSLRFNYKISAKFSNVFSISYGLFDRSNSFREFNDDNSKSGVIELRENDSYLVSNNIKYQFKNSYINIGLDYYNETFQNNLKDKGFLQDTEFDQLLSREKLLDYQNEFTRLNLNSSLELTQNFYWNIYSMMEINRMNTTSDQENKDRDLLTIRFGSEASYIFSEFLNLKLMFEGRARHLVYLRSEFSADNNWERYLRMRPSIEYNIGNFSMRPSVEIFVNYRDFDLPDITTNIRSDAQRLIRFQDTISYSFSSKYSIRTSFFHLYKETGKLDWENFTQSIDEIKQETFVNSLIYLTKENFISGVGLRYYSLTNESQISLLIGSNDLYWESISPETNIIWKISEMTSIELSGWYEFRFNKNSFETIPNLYLQTILNF